MRKLPGSGNAGGATARPESLLEALFTTGCEAQSCWRNSNTHWADSAGCLGLLCWPSRAFGCPPGSAQAEPLPRIALSSQTKESFSSAHTGALPVMAKLGRPGATKHQPLQSVALSESSHESVGSAHGVLPVTAGWPCCLAGLAAGGHDRIRTNPHTELEIVFRPTLTRTWSGLPPNWIPNANPHAHLARAAILSYD